LPTLSLLTHDYSLPAGSAFCIFNYTSTPILDASLYHSGGSPSGNQYARGLTPMMVGAHEPSKNFFIRIWHAKLTPSTTPPPRAKVSGVQIPARPTPTPIRQPAPN